MRAYRVVSAGAETSWDCEAHRDQQPADKPSIAVLPLANMSGDPEQEYFSDGITEDIITELARFSELLVIARNSSFIYKGKSLDIRRIAQGAGRRLRARGQRAQIRKPGERPAVAAAAWRGRTPRHPPSGTRLQPP